MKTQIERLDLAGKSGSEVGQWIDDWKHLRAEGWEVTVIPVEEVKRGLRKVVALVGFGYQRSLISQRWKQ